MGFETLFCVLVFVIIYTYVLYPLILHLISLFYPKPEFPKIAEYPDITIVVCAFNEEYIIRSKVENCKLLDYPQNRIKYLWVTDGSTDNSNAILSEYPDIKVLFTPERAGKIGAINRAIKEIDTPVSVFTDANSMLCGDALIKLVWPFFDPGVGCVSGVKRITRSIGSSDTEQGEGIYWHYESFVKRKESETGSTIGAVGELFAIRTSLLKTAPPDTVNDDLFLSSGVFNLGYKVKYAPEAFAGESPSASVSEEEKRKVRIAAGAFQFMFRNLFMFNILKHPFFTFKYLSHKVSRWMVVPIAMALLIPLNVILIFIHPELLFYKVFAIFQVLFYSPAVFPAVFYRILPGMITKVFAVSNYFIRTNICQMKGLYRYLTGNQGVNWQKSIRQ